MSSKERNRPSASSATKAINEILKRPANNSHQPPNEQSNRHYQSKQSSGQDNRKSSSTPVLTIPATTRSALPSSSVSKLDEKIFGVIVSIKPVFGFIQPFFDDTQIYFPERDFYPNMKIGDIIEYQKRASSKGPVAFNLSPLIPIHHKIIPGVLGVIVKMPDRQSVYGIIEVDAKSIPATHTEIITKLPSNKIVFKLSDVIAGSSFKGKIDVGDLMEFTLATVDKSLLYVAHDIKLKKMKKDLLMAEHIQKMLDAGAVREIGVVSMVKPNEFGMIRGQDRKDEIFFRVDDVLDTDAEIKTGIELEYFVIPEMVRGKLSDRAMHLKVLPPGTVKLEVLVASNISVIVTKEPRSSGGDEIPGTALLFTPIDVSALTNQAQSAIKEIDLWARCMPDDLISKVGDILQINIHYYRPEKIFFARSVKVQTYRSLGRDEGIICTIKEHNFGFITSDLRKVDFYFKTNYVLDKKMNVIPEKELSVGMKVSYEIVNDDGKYRAIKVQLISPKSNQDELDSKYLLKESIYGVVLRNAAKKDSLGLIQISPSLWKELHDTPFVEPNIRKTLQDFVKMVVLKELKLFAMTPMLISMYEELIRSDFPNVLFYQVDQDISLDYPQLKIMIITKTKNDQSVIPSLHPALYPTKGSLMLQSKDSGSTISFSKEDYISEEFGPLASDLEVVFDIYWSPMKGKRIAKRIRLSDEPILEDNTTGVINDDKKTGVVDVVVEKGDKFGFIRCIPSDEKLFWHISNAKKPNDIIQGAVVEYQLRRRGGIRCATNIKLLDTRNILKTSILVVPEPNLGLVISETSVILLDTQSNSSLKSKFIDLAILETMIQANNDIDSKQWQKVSSNSVPVVPPPPLALDPSFFPALQNEETFQSFVTSNPSSAPILSIPAHSSNPDEFKRIEYKAKFFTPLSRNPINIQNTDILTTKNIKIGDIVVCNVNLQPYIQRQPCSVVISDIYTSSTPIKSVCRKGRITKSKFRMKEAIFNSIPIFSNETQSEVSFNKQFASTLDFIEMIEEKNLTDTENVIATMGYYYCIYEDINIGSRESSVPLQVGDEVEFFSYSQYPHLAFGTKVIKKSMVRETEVVFQSKGPGINEKLKEMKTKVGTPNLVSMAQGPPTDFSVGFESGWRTYDPASIQSLPWAHNLQHLFV